MYYTNKPASCVDCVWPNRVDCIFVTSAFLYFLWLLIETRVYLLFKWMNESLCSSSSTSFHLRSKSFEVCSCQITKLQSEDISCEACDRQKTKDKKKKQAHLLLTLRHTWCCLKLKSKSTQSFSSLSLSMSDFWLLKHRHMLYIYI